MTYNGKHIFSLFVDLWVSWNLSASDWAWLDLAPAVSWIWVCSRCLVLGAVTPWGIFFSWQIAGAREARKTMQTHPNFCSHIIGQSKSSGQAQNQWGRVMGSHIRGRKWVTGSNNPIGHDITGNSFLFPHTWMIVWLSIGFYVPLISFSFS